MLCQGPTPIAQGYAVLTFTPFAKGGTEPTHRELHDFAHHYHAESLYLTLIEEMRRWGERARYMGYFRRHTGEECDGHDIKTDVDVL